jgi:ubiquitin carboxyl-terminal hydrolase 8
VSKGEQFKSEVNRDNPLGCKGVLAYMFQFTLKLLWLSPPLGSIKNDMPRLLKEEVGKKAEQFWGSTQQDAQEFMLTFLDLLHEV